MSPRSTVMVKVGDRVREAGKERDTRNITKSGHIGPEVEHQARSHGVGGSAEYGHARRSIRVQPAIARDLSRKAPFFGERMRIRERRKVIAVESTLPRAGAPDELYAFIDIKMMFAEVFAQEQQDG